MILFVASTGYNHHQSVATANKSDISETTAFPINGFTNSSTIEGATDR